MHDVAHVLPPAVEGTVRLTGLAGLSDFVAKAARAGQSFWGCSGYPECKGTRAISEESNRSDGSDKSDKGES